MKLTAMFRKFARSEQFGGVLLLACTAISLALANSALAPAWLEVWHLDLGPLSLAHWIDDVLMAIFFLLIGLELRRELLVGELSNLRSALFPVFAAIGGMAAPALIHVAFNGGSPTQAGFGIPMATDIAFSLGAIALLGTRVPVALKVFVVAFAVIDDLGAIIVIAAVYTDDLSVMHFGLALGTWVLLYLLNRVFGVMALWPYLLGGILLWYFVHEAGIHATIAGVVLAFAIPFRGRSAEQASPSSRLEGGLHRPVPYFILPLFALANTAIPIDAGAVSGLTSDNAVGIALGLLVGKPVGVLLACVIAVKVGAGSLPDQSGWRHIAGAGMLGGIGFTMSIFITNLAFGGDDLLVNVSKLSVLGASLLAGVLGYLWLRAIPAVRNS